MHDTQVDVTPITDAPGTTTRLRTLLTLAWPIVIARATQAVIGFCDALMVAPLGEDALAAVTTGALNVLTFIMLPMGSVFIVQSFAAQLRGRGDLEAARRYAVVGLAFAALAGLFAIASIPLVPPILGLLGLAPEVRDLMASYLTPRLISIAALVGAEALNSWYGGLGNTRIALWIGVFTMVLNIFGNYALIEPHFGLPGYGVTGAAWASALASMCGFAAVFVLFLRGVGHDLPGGPLRMRVPELWRVVRFGLPSGINWFLEFAAFAVFINVVVAHLGTTVLAAFNVVFQINAISFMPAFGIASAGSILVGEAIGKRAQDQVWPIVRVTLMVAGGWMCSVGVLYVLIPAHLMGLFQTEAMPAESLVQIGATMLALCGIWQVFDATTITYSEALRAAGDTAWPMKARIVLAWFAFTPMAWSAVFLFRGEVVTVMIAVIAYLAVLAAVLAWRFHGGHWKTIDLVGDGDVDPVTAAI